MLTEDIARDLEPEAAGTSVAPETPAPARPRRGHGPKLWAAFEALEAEGLLPEHLRTVARARVVTDWLMRHGYANDMPGRDTIEREYQRWLRERNG